MARGFPETTTSMTRKPKSLSDVMAQKPAAAQAPTAVPASGETRILTLRLTPLAHDQLREMAFVSRRSQQSLVMEALNDLFAKLGKPPIA
jgi:antitoxin-like ribbon-helix-helix protein